MLWVFKTTLNSGSVCLTSIVLVSDIPESSDSASKCKKNSTLEYLYNVSDYSRTRISCLQGWGEKSTLAMSLLSGGFSLIE